MEIFYYLTCPKNVQYFVYSFHNDKYSGQWIYRKYMPKH